MVDMEAAMSRSLFRPKVVTFGFFFNCSNYQSFLCVYKSPGKTGLNFSLRFGLLVETFDISRNCVNRNINRPKYPYNFVHLPQHQK